MENVCYVEPLGLSGGLALWWKNDIHITIDTKEVSLINTTIDMNKGDGVIHITWIYGSTSWDERLHLWEKLKNIARARPRSWTCIREFNEITREVKGWTTEATKNDECLQRDDARYKARRYGV